MPQEYHVAMVPAVARHAHLGARKKRQNLGTALVRPAHGAQFSSVNVVHENDTVVHRPHHKRHQQDYQDPHIEVHLTAMVLHHISPHGRCQQ